MSRFLKLLKDKVQQVPIIAQQTKETAFTAASSGYNQVNSIVNTARSTGRIMKWSIVLISSGVFLYGVSRVMEAWPKKEKD
jgi:hypothetical protein